MSADYKSLVRDIEAIKGALAWGIRQGDKSFHTFSRSDSFPQAMMDNVVRCLVDTYAMLGLHQLSGPRLRWVYEKAYLHCAMNSQDACLAIFTGKQLSEEDRARLEEVMGAFLAAENASSL